MAIERILMDSFTVPLAEGDPGRARACLARRGFRGVGFETGKETSAGPLDAQWLQPQGEEAESAGTFLGELAALASVRAAERTEAEIIRFELDPSGDRATGIARLRWAGPDRSTGKRTDLTLFVEVEFQRSASHESGPEWQLTTCLAASPDVHAHGSGLKLVGPASPLLVDRTEDVGLSFGTSHENRDLIQSFVDRHLTFALGGLSAVDYNGDGLTDLIATRSEETSLVFVNDGDSGFVPEPLPVERQADHPAFMLAVDLDGDGLDELVASQVVEFEGPSAFAGLWTRSPIEKGDEPGPWRHLPRAFDLPNPVGMRRLAVQTVVPMDVEGDGDLDLFFAVYGNAASRGERYNSVEAHDGARNYLLINQGGLRFTEESAERGIHGTGYTYIALGFDADHDGDTDLFEGNDFGPNVLWRNHEGQFEADEALGLHGVSAYTMGAALADLEADGTWDLYVSNMSSEEGMRMVSHAAGLSDGMRGRVDTIARGNMLYREPDEPAAPWTESAETVGVHEGEWAWGCQFMDVDGDGAQEILVTNGFASHQEPELGDWQTYYWRQVIADGVRLQTGERTEDVNTKVRFQGSFNGHERDRLFVRTEGTDVDRPWVDGGYCLGFDGAHDGRAIVPFDPDGDGDLDVAILTLGGLKYLENVSVRGNSWVRLRLLDGAGRPALGARAYVTAGGLTQARHVAIVEGFQSQVSTDVHVSLSTGANDPVELKLVWADGSTETLSEVPVGKLVTVQPGGVVTGAPLPKWPTKAAADDSAVTIRTEDGDVLRRFRTEPGPGVRAAFQALAQTERAVPHLLIEHGRAALEEARYRDALAIFHRALDDRPDLSVADAPGFEGLARAHVYLGRIDLAEAAYRRSIELDPDYAIGHFNLAATYAHQGRFAEAIDALLEVQRLEGDSDRVLGALVENAGSAGLADLAREYAGRWLAKYPEDAQMLILIGKVEARAKQLHAAKEHFEAALRIEPRNGEAKAALALTLKLLGQSAAPK